ncbi:hypothetical protein AOQ84DRAFT_352546 [Glonium stellatum]|uniref:Uncharacterized protein n=1 Tax=Glonium stellatum TaxID=574774 RepID=A0A8E2F8J0_9PEZI|nr:hypothetical protein AOQ84DRAFT_352546 [Glonium stellatum]
MAYCVRVISTAVKPTASTAVFQSILEASLHGVLGNAPGGSELIKTLSADFSKIRSLDSAVKFGV